MRENIFKLFILSLCSYGGFCGDVVVGLSPPNLRFGQGSSLHLSNFDDVLAASLGYTPQNFIWKGLTVTTPFPYPSAVVVLGLRDGGVPIKLEGTVYNLKEDTSFKNAYEDLTSLISSRSQRPVCFKDISATDLIKNTPSSYTIPTPKVLSTQNDSAFLDEMSFLPTLADYIEPFSRLTHGGQDAVFVDIYSYASLVKKYGSDSKQVKEASNIVRNSLTQTIARLEKFYGNEVVVMTTLLNKPDQSLLRKKREDVPLINEKDSSVQEVDYNLGTVYDADYPVIFNIILIFTVIMFVSLLAISVAIAFMDPGRDSIIYRMTNPRMKKDQ